MTPAREPGVVGRESRGSVVSHGPLSVRVAALVILAGCATLTSYAQMGGPYGNVKTFTGTVIVDASMTSREGGLIRTSQFRAEGPVTIADENFPDGMHFQWPSPNPAALAKGDVNAARGWRVHLTYSSSETEPRLSALAPGRKLTCSAVEDLRGTVGLTAPMGMGKFMLGITPPDPQRVHCTGMLDGNVVNTTEPQPLQGVQFNIEGKAPGPITGSQDVVVGDWRAHVTYNLAPAQGR